MSSFKFYGLALYVKCLKDLKSQLFYMAFLLIPAVLLSTSDYYLVHSVVHSSPEIQVLSSDDGASHYTRNDLHLGVGNTTEAQRVDDNSKIESRVKSQESESFKVFDLRNNFLIKASCFSYANIIKQHHLSIQSDSPVFLQKLQI